MSLILLSMFTFGTFSEKKDEMAGFFYSGFQSSTCRYYLFGRMHFQFGCEFGCSKVFRGFVS